MAEYLFGPVNTCPRPAHPSLPPGPGARRRPLLRLDGRVTGHCTAGRINRAAFRRRAGGSGRTAPFAALLGMLHGHRAAGLGADEAAITGHQAALGRQSADII